MIGGGAVALLEPVARESGLPLPRGAAPGPRSGVPSADPDRGSTGAAGPLPSGYRRGYRRRCRRGALGGLRSSSHQGSSRIDPHSRPLPSPSGPYGPSAAPTARSRPAAGTPRRSDPGPLGAAARRVGDSASLTAPAAPLPRPEPTRPADGQPPRPELPSPQNRTHGLTRLAARRRRAAAGGRVEPRSAAAPRRGGRAAGGVEPRQGRSGSTSILTMSPPGQPLPLLAPEVLLAIRAVLSPEALLATLAFVALHA